MSNYLNQLAARALGRREPVRPRLPSLFEPPTGAPALPPAEAAEAAPPFFERRTDAPATIQAPAPRLTPSRDAHPPAPDAAAQTLAPPEPRLTPRPREAWRARREGEPAAPAWPGERATEGESPTLRSVGQATETAAPPHHTRAEAPAPVEVVRSTERQADEASEGARAAQVAGGEGEPARGLARRVAALEAAGAERQERRESRGTADDALMRPASPPAPPPAGPRPPTLATRGIERGDGPPQVHVTIGRVEVRAVFPPPPAAPPAPRPRPATQTLAEYLKRRERGGR